MSQRRIVVTGMGLICPVGLSVQESWKNLLAGKSGIAPIESYDVSEYPTRFGGEIKGFNAENYLPKKDVRKLDPFVHYGAAATQEALKDSGFEITEENTERVGICLGSGMGGVTTIFDNCVALENQGVRRVSPFFIPTAIINILSGYLSMQLGIKGPNLAPVSACTTGLHSIGLGARLIQAGDADVMITGGSEMASSQAGLGGFSAARALSKRNDDPEAASRPWDKDRDGFVLSDGAGTLILESYEHATARGADIKAELIGFGMSGDAYHFTLPSEDGDGAARCMTNALSDAGIGAEAVQYINAHGTSTPAGDIAETLAIRKAMGAHADNLAVSSTKSMTGHMLGAAGAAEAIISILALRDQVAPPTINLDNQDENCDLDYVPHEAREMSIDVVMSNSFGFGGTNGTLLFSRAS